ncbi:hypothetical protein M885DRAFT_613836 [Pelagophyceae sp. CCMP2097]|nr:hypothetical protein M885DRAFT_613836 [Pelagophyceae sp. CCMP2097]|mmetsp:Transcript_20090/g.68054  ORF Transcript_20090/g.68054 Transcript_20090/m.68054 type:complete len:274 (-) Transcript_20090:93-914(-)
MRGSLAFFLPLASLLSRVAQAWAPTRLSRRGLSAARASAGDDEAQPDVAAPSKVDAAKAEAYADEFAIRPNFEARVAARVRADLQLVVDGERDLQERIHDSARSLWQWTSFMIRANTLGLTDGVDVRRPIGDRLRMALNDFREGDDDDLAEDDIQTSWDSIHLESNARFADDDLDDDGPDRESFADEDDDSEDFPRRASASDLDSRELIRIVGADEWAKIKSSSFLVTAGVVKDATLQGKWSVKAGAMTFARDEFDSDAPEALESGAPPRRPR